MEIVFGFVLGIAIGAKIFFVIYKNDIDKINDKW